MTIILVLFLIFLFLFMFATSIVLSIVRWILTLFGFGGKRKDSHDDDRQTYSRYNNSSSAETTSGWHYSPEAEYKRSKRKKIIKQDEGEYVDYEEIK